MAVPKLATPQPFRLLDPQHLTVVPQEAAAHEMAMQVGRPVGVDEMQPVDLIVCGSVAVNRQGVRLGKGAGYSDLEVALLTEAGLLTDATIIVTTVHPLQVLAQELPETEHDVRVDLIVTPDDVITSGPGLGRNRDQHVVVSLTGQVRDALRCAATRRAALRCAALRRSIATVLPDDKAARGTTVRRRRWTRPAMDGARGPPAWR